MRRMALGFLGLCLTISTIGCKGETTTDTDATTTPPPATEGTETTPPATEGAATEGAATEGAATAPATEGGATQ